MRSGRRPATSTLLAVLAVVWGPSCGDGSEGAVEMTSDRAFTPATITVAPGETIEFVNRSGEAHTVTAYEDSLPEGGDYWASGEADDEAAARSSLQSGLLVRDATFEVTLGAPGTYRYFCIPHEEQGMTGTIVVAE